MQSTPSEVPSSAIDGLNGPACLVAGGQPTPVAVIDHEHWHSFLLLVRGRPRYDCEGSHVLQAMNLVCHGCIQVGPASGHLAEQPRSRIHVCRRHGHEGQEGKLDNSNLVRGEAAG